MYTIARRWEFKNNVTRPQKCDNKIVKKQQHKTRTCKLEEKNREQTSHGLIHPCKL